MFLAVLGNYYVYLVLLLEEVFFEISQNYLNQSLHQFWNRLALRLLIFIWILQNLCSTQAGNRINGRITSQDIKYLIQVWECLNSVLNISCFIFKICLKLNFGKSCLKKCYNKKIRSYEKYYSKTSMNILNYLILIFYNRYHQYFIILVICYSSLVFKCYAMFPIRTWTIIGRCVSK